MARETRGPGFAVEICQVLGYLGLILVTLVMSCAIVTSISTIK